MRKLFILLAICISASAAAQDFKILFVNTGTVKIGGKELSAGDVFNQTDNIQWSNDKQAIKALSLADNKQYIFVSEDFKERKLKSAKDYLVKTNRLSTRGSGSLSSVGRKLSDTIYAMDATMVPIDYVPDTSEYFFVTNQGERHVLAYEDRCIVLSPEVWANNDVAVVDLFYHYANGDEECIKEGIQIIPLPKELKDLKKKKRFLFF